MDRSAWPLPTALGAAAGVAVTAAGVPPALAVGGSVALAVGMAWTLRDTPGGPAPGRGSERGPARGSAGRATRATLLLPVLLSLLALPLGALRMAGWLRASDPLAGRSGEVVLAGVSDGRTLSLHEPPGARVALTPAGAAPVGRVTLRGELLDPPGRRNPGGFDYRGYLRRRGIWRQLWVSEVLEQRPPGLRARVRARLQRALGRGLPPESVALMEAMTLGVRDDLGELRDAFAAAGLAHVLALSGLHVGVLLGALGWALRPLALARYPLLLALLAGFVLLVGASPSVLRAAAMATAVMLGLWRGTGRLEPWRALAYAALATLAYNPSWLLDLSFQLSYGAVAGLLLFGAPLARTLLLPLARRPLRDLPWWDPRTPLVAGVAATVASQLLTLPLLFANFGQLPLLSPFINVVGVPLASLLVPLGFGAALLGALWEPLAALPNALVAPLSGVLVALARWGAEGPALIWGEVGAPGYGVFAAVMLALALRAHGFLRAWRAPALLAAGLVYAALPPAAPPEVVFLDVGQGDAALVRLRGGREVLIDGGGTPFSDFDVGARTVVPALRALGVEALEVVVASHADADHIEGLLSVLRELPVGELVVGAVEPERPLFRRLVEVARARGVPLRPVRRGEAFELGRARFEVLHPGADAAGGNPDSVALLLRLDGAPRALFLGDAPEGVEARLQPPPTPLLMAAHHGSPSSTSAALLRAVRPRLAVISAGRNTFGHPAPEVLERLAAAGAAVYLTRRDGAVRVSLETLEVRVTTGATATAAARSHAAAPGSGRGGGWGNPFRWGGVSGPLAGPPSSRSSRCFHERRAPS